MFNPKVRFERNRILVAAVFAMIAFSFSLLIALNRDSLMERDYTEGAGEFRQDMDPVLMKSAEDFIYKQLARDNEVCVGEWIGRDDKYVYMGIRCAQFSESMGNITALGDQNYHATRFRYKGDTVTHYEQPDETNLKYSLRSLFPKAAYQWFRIQTNPEKFLKKGMEKTQILSERNS